MVTTFALALELVLGVEGGFVHHPMDNGGETKFGISARAHPGIDIRSITLDEAKRIYWRDYALPIQFESLAEISESVAIATFDAAVHHGPSQASRFLQRAAGMDNGGLDGVVGPKTLRRVAEWVVLDETELLNRFHTIRLMHFVQIVQADPDQHQFLKGWIRRVVNMVGFTFLPTVNVEMETSGEN